MCLRKISKLGQIKKCTRCGRDIYSILPTCKAIVNEMPGYDEVNEVPKVSDNTIARRCVAVQSTHISGHAQLLANVCFIDGDACYLFAKTKTTRENIFGVTSEYLQWENCTMEQQPTSGASKAALAD